MKINTIILAIALNATYVYASGAGGSSKNTANKYKFNCVTYPPHPVMLDEVPERLSLKTPDESAIVRASWDPMYYVNKSEASKDISLLTPSELGELIRKHGSLDPICLHERVMQLPQPLHPKVNDLFVRLLYYYNKNPYIGHLKSNLGYTSPGWVGGISLELLFLLNNLAHIQDKLGSTLKFLDIGSGSGFSGELFRRFGDTICIDVCDSSLDDYPDIKRIIDTQNFFMPVKMYETHIGNDAAKKERIEAQIIEDVFSGVDYATTVLVFSWPREFANKYLQHFIKNGGNTILFICNDTFDGVFDEGHLGSDVGARKIKAVFDFAFSNSSFSSGAPRSEFKLYCRNCTKNNPIEKALRLTQSDDQLKYIPSIDALDFDKNGELYLNSETRSIEIN